jgi:hypothetical protein
LARRLRHARSVNVPSRLSSLGRMKALASWAEHLAQALLQESLPRLWAHVQGVAARAHSLAIRSRRGRRSPARRRLAARRGSGSAASAAAADGDGRVGGLE